MRVLVACERSGIVRDAFRARGHDAWSCDLAPASDGSVYHLQTDAQQAAYDQRWDLLIAHPPCTYFCNSGVWALHATPPHPSPGTLYGDARRQALEAAGALWLALAHAPVPRIAIENPVPHRYARRFTGPYQQTVQPYQFGDDASKRTCLWLTGLLPLVLPPRAAWVAPRLVDGRPRWANQTDSGQNRLPPSADRWELRSRTYPGLAAAMAAQWGTLTALPADVAQRSLFDL